MLEGLSLYHYVAYESMFPHIVNNLKHRLEVITPAVYGASITEELAAVPLTGTQSDKLIKRMYLKVKYFMYFLLKWVFFIYFFYEIKYSS